MKIKTPHLSKAEKPPVPMAAAVGRVEDAAERRTNSDNLDLVKTSKLGWLIKISVDFG